MKKVLCILSVLIIIIGSGNIVFAQNSYVNYEKEFKTLSPPPPPVRQTAEFEPMQGVLIRYPFGISYDIIAEMSEDVEVVTIVTDSSEQSYVESQYVSHGINLSHCNFLIAPSDSYWTRNRRFITAKRRPYVN